MPVVLLEIIFALLPERQYSKCQGINFLSFPENIFFAAHTLLISNCLLGWKPRVSYFCIEISGPTLQGKLWSGLSSGNLKYQLTQKEKKISDVQSSLTSFILFLLFTLFIIACGFGGQVCLSCILCEAFK